MTTESIDLSETTTILYSSDTTDFTPTNIDDILSTENNFNIENITKRFEHARGVPEGYQSGTYYETAFYTFNILEIVMTSLELMLWMGAAIKMSRWRRNYRNQMLIQISVARFIKRLLYTFNYLQEYYEAFTSWDQMCTFLRSLLIYIDVVVVILVVFFIKHMYDSLLIVLVKCRKNSLYKVSLCVWLVPLPISAIWTAIIIFTGIDEKLVYLIFCCIFRWPLIFIGTGVYITVLCRVLSDKIRKFARSLTVVTFLMCLVINFYLFSKDVIELWCEKSDNTKLLSYVSGFVMNSLILTLYIILITMDRCHGNTPKDARSYNIDHSLAETQNFRI